MKINIFWFRRDLRLHDNSGLYHALNAGLKVVPIFIFDSKILDQLQDKVDARVTFIHDTITRLSSDLQDTLGSILDVRYGDPAEVWPQLLHDYEVQSVFANHDYEPYAISRDSQVKDFLSAGGVDFNTFKDHVIFEKDEVIKDDGTPYTVFTPYKRKWLAKLIRDDWDGKACPLALKSWPSEDLKSNFIQKSHFRDIPSLSQMGFQRSEIRIPSTQVSQTTIMDYDKTRDFPAIAGTSKLGVHFRFGTISIREKAMKALKLNQVYLSELIWRDFYAMILYQFPHIVKKSFRPEYDNIPWRNNEEEFKAWCEGKTGYPIVDAGMRELATTGYMHNRVRMITASFLTKHLLIDWRWGESWFAAKLLDYDLASNNGGWQWAAGCGTDAAPYFRIFSPDAQQEKFDKLKVYIKKWVPEVETVKYPKPIVDHKYARERCLEVYKRGLQKN